MTYEEVAKLAAKDDEGGFGDEEELETGGGEYGTGSVDNEETSDM